VLIRQRSDAWTRIAAIKPCTTRRVWSNPLDFRAVSPSTVM
jgi:hypothetical protein